MLNEKRDGSPIVSSRSMAARVSLLAGLCMLGACAPVTPGPNPAASAEQGPADVPLATRPTAGQEVGAVVNNQVVVTFAPGSARLSPGADTQLDLAARLFRDVHPVQMFVSGYADQTGQEYPNLLLSAARAQIVKEALVARGIGPDHLLLQAFGQSDPADHRDPDAPANRRVVITWRIL